ncbi:MAG: DUF4254 domain-containing protein [Paludibacteraceae bacterium]|nr:DUF4254 domain-containing protein [Paludibacteraceae bacterium]
MNFVDTANAIFAKAVEDYHLKDDVDAQMINPYATGSIEHDLYTKNWIDTVQWHLEDIIRDPNINPVDALALKHRIDHSNQDRTDLVERIDSYFWEQYNTVKHKTDARINTESPAWAIDRLSILHVKIFHMNVEVNRTDADATHIKKCNDKLAVLKEQLADMTTSISQLLADYESGEKIMKVYRQMKMYNDPDTNPVLYGK